MGRDLAFSCTCGRLAGHLTDISPRHGTHALCFCNDCRAAPIYLGHPDPAPEPLGVFQMDPHRIRFDAGTEHLAAFRIYNRSRLLRWYAACCNTPLFNTWDTPRFAFASILTDAVQDPAGLGPVTVRAHVKQPNGRRKHEGLLRFISGTLRRAGTARLTGRWKQSPFFHPATRNPVVTPVTLTREERARLPLKDQAEGPLA